MVAQPAKIDNTMLWGKVGLFLLYIFHACTDKIYVVSTEKYVVLFYRYVGAEREKTLYTDECDLKQIQKDIKRV